MSNTKKSSDFDGLINPGDSFKVTIDVMNKSFNEQYCNRWFLYKE